MKVMFKNKRVILGGAVVKYDLNVNGKTVGTVSGSAGFLVGPNWRAEFNDGLVIENPLTVTGVAQFKEYVKKQLENMQGVSL